MNLNLKKSMLLVSAFTAFGVSYSPAVYAAENVVVQSTQQKTVSGTVVDANGPIIGATVIEKGTNNATVTDIDGNFQLKVKTGATLVVTYLGYTPQEVKVGAQAKYSVTLKEDATGLEEVVVVGYGVQKKKLVTGATVEVKGEDIQKMNTTQVLGALQSQTPGVNIQAASGQPGDGFKIAIRGAGTNGDTKPLYIIDGVPGDINNLSPADIERIDVLKDAASAAIYGSAAANGVILVTTKQGKEGKIQVTYDGNVGWADIYRLPQMLTAKQYMEIMDLTEFNSGNATWDWSRFVDADLLEAYRNGSNPGTNWVEAIRNKHAVTTSHALNIAGGTDRSKFSVGAGYQFQDGVFGGKFAKSDFSRMTFRVNSEHVLYRNDHGMDVVKVGENVYYRHTQKEGVQIGNQYSNVLSDALRANPLIPIYNKDGELFMYDDMKASGSEGWFAYNQFSSNPAAKLALTQSGNNKNASYGLNATAYIEVQPIKNLTYRGQFNYNQSSWSYRAYTHKYHMNDQADGHVDQDYATNQVGLGWGWSTTNTLNYKFDVATDHHFDALVGTEYGQSKPDYGFSLSATAKNSVFGNLVQGYMDYMKDNNTANVSGAPYDDVASMSYFGRINYNFNETYMFSAIMRADGSSKFAPGKRWGYFPSVSAGWVVSNEAFMQATQSWMDYLKIRAGWGQNGNQAISNFQWMPTFQYGAMGNYSFNNNKDGYTAGAYPSRLGNEDLTWETSEQLDLGIDARFLSQRLSLTFDWYRKTTRDLLVAVPVDPTTGFSTAVKNAGTVQNQGIELALGWNDKVGDFHYGVNWNMALNKNKVTAINSNKTFYDAGDNLLSQGAEKFSRFELNHPIGYFYGFKTAGVIQNVDELAAYKATLQDGNAANSLQGENLKVGDLKFVDINGDGIINDDDKTEIGSPHPDVTMGINLTASYKGFDFSVTGYAALGQEVAKSYRKFLDGKYENYTTEVYKYWNGEGTSDKYPLFNIMSEGANWQRISDIYIENASYFRLQNITFGYDFNRLWKKSPFQQLRLYVSAQNLFTITGYTGMDPENGMSLDSANPWMTGVDVGNYPQPRTFMVGVNVKF